MSELRERKAEYMASAQKVYECMAAEERMARKVWRAQQEILRRSVGAVADEGVQVDFAQLGDVFKKEKELQEKWLLKLNVLRSHLVDMAQVNRSVG